MAQVIALGGVHQVQGNSVITTLGGNKGVDCSVEKRHFRLPCVPWLRSSQKKSAPEETGALPLSTTTLS